MDGVVDAMVQKDYKLRVEVWSIAHFHLFYVNQKALLLTQTHIVPCQEKRQSNRQSPRTQHEYKGKLSDMARIPYAPYPVPRNGAK